MTSFITALKDSFSLLKAEPKLFLPKFAVAALFSIPLLAFPNLAYAVFSLSADREEMLGIFWMLTALLLLSTLVDIIVNTMYPFMVRDYFSKKPISISRAFGQSLSRFSVVAPAVVVVDLLVIGLAVLASIPLGIALLTGNTAMAALVLAATLLVLFIVMVLFYLVYPVSALENKSPLAALRQALSLSMKNRLDISKATAITFIISLAAFALAFAIDIYSKSGFVEGGFVAGLLFIGIRFATAMLYTYQYVLNPVMYLEYGAKVAA